MYNDDVRFGGFCKIEYHGPAKVLEQNEKLGHTVMLSIIFWDLEMQIEVTAEELGVKKR